MSDAASSRWEIRDFGLGDYAEVWALQKALVQARLYGDIPDTLLLGEHPPVLTLGRGVRAENLLNPSLPTVTIERGGDVTYHGPGQLIAYPILKLEAGRRDLHAYLRQLEAGLFQTLSRFGLQGERNPGWTGAWVRSSPGGEPLKIASIGVAVKQWVTYHGLALNVSTDLAAYRQINPCGLPSTVMTSLEALLGEPVAMGAVKTALAESLYGVLHA